MLLMLYPRTVIVDNFIVVHDRNTPSRMERIGRTYTNRKISVPSFEIQIDPTCLRRDVHKATTIRRAP